MSHMTLNSERKKTTQSRKEWAKPGTAQPYYYGENETNQSQSEINIADEASQSNVSASRTQNCVDDYEDHIKARNLRNQSKISNLNLFNENSDECNTALLLKDDTTLEKLNACSPDQMNFNFNDDSNDQRRIDDAYSNNNKSKVDLLRERLNSNIGSALDDVPSDLKVQYKGLTDVNTGTDLASIGKKDTYNPNFKEDEEGPRLENQRSKPYFGLPTQEKRDAILDSTHKQHNQLEMSAHNQSLASKLDRLKGIFNDLDSTDNNHLDDNQSDDNQRRGSNESSGDKLVVPQTPLRTGYGSSKNYKTIEIKENMVMNREDDHLESSYLQQTPMHHKNAIPHLREERPMTQKQRDIKELMELAQLVQEATGSINNVVESFQNFKPMPHR